MADAYLTRRGSVVRTGTVYSPQATFIEIPGIDNAQNVIITLYDEVATIDSGTIITSLTIENGVITSAISNVYIGIGSAGVVSYSKQDISEIFMFSSGYSSIGINVNAQITGDLPDFSTTLPYKYILY